MICPLFLGGSREVMQGDESVRVFAILVKGKPLALDAHFKVDALNNILVVCSCEMNIMK